MKSRVKFRAGVVRAILDLFRAAIARSEALRGVVKTYQLAQGTDADDILPDRWAVDLFPVLRLDLEAMGGGYKTQATQQSRLVLVVTLGVPGTDPRDAADFWEMVVAVLFPCDRSLIDPLAAHGVHGYSIDQPAINQTVTYPDGSGQIVTGRVSIPYEYKARP